MTKISVSLAALAASLFVCGAARAADEPGGSMPAVNAAPAPQRWEAPCKADVEKLCKGQKDVRGCLTDHEAELAVDCQKPLRQTNILDACNDDFEKLCKDERAKGTLSKCITDKKAELSEKCRSVLDRSAKKTTVETVTVTKPAPKKGAKPAKKAK